jgi:ATP-dependent DNA helicase DinG
LNHNYFLADLNHRSSGKRPLIPNYQTVVIDEAHKFLPAARSMLGAELASRTLPEIKDVIYELNFIRETDGKLARTTAKELFDESRRLFRALNENIPDEETDDDATRFTAVIDADGTRHLRNLRNIADTLYELMTCEPVSTNGEGKKSDILWDLLAARESLSSLARHSEHICWLEMPNKNVTSGIEQETKLCAIPKDLDSVLSCSPVTKLWIWCGNCFPSASCRSQCSGSTKAAFGRLRNSRQAATAFCLQAARYGRA